MLNRNRNRNTTCVITPINRLAIYNRCSISMYWNNVVSMLKKRRELHMTIVVKKVPKFLRGFVKFIFRIKD